MDIYHWWCEVHFKTGDEDTCQIIEPAHNTCSMIPCQISFPKEEK